MTIRPIAADQEIKSNQTMQFAFTEEQMQFRDIVARFCHDKCPTTTTRKLADTAEGFEPAVWQQLTQELGLVGIHIPESLGGIGFGAVELGIVMEEFGRALVAAPYFSTAVLACTAVAEVDDPVVRDSLIGPMVKGEKRGTLALDPACGHPATNVQVDASDKLSGNLKAVADAVTADYLLVIAGDGTLYQIDKGAPGVSIQPMRTMDTTRRMANVTLENSRAKVLATLNEGQIKRIYDTALIALANEMVGGAQALLASALEYTRIRVQFGRSIASFQAIKHRLADLHVDVEMARVGAYQAAASLAADEDVSVNASLAKFMASDTYIKAARECIQLHGGIGFTWENDTHLWYRRAKSSEVLLGTAPFHRERMLKEMNV